MSQEYEYQVLRTYARAWKLERVIYRIENWTLPFPVTYDQVVIFLGCEALIFSLRVVPFIGRITTWKPFFWWVLLPLGLTWYLTNYAVDGKNPLKYVWARLRHWYSGKLINRYREYGLPWWHPKTLYLQLEIIDHLPISLRRAVKTIRARR